LAQVSAQLLTAPTCRLPGTCSSGMDTGRDELTAIQAELKAVKRALRDETSYLGMESVTLQRYFLQLNEKENILLSQQLRGLSCEASEAAVGNGLGSGSGYGLGAPVTALAVASGGQAPRLQPRDPPPGEPKAFSRNSLTEVLSHMCDYEALPIESAKALRALSSLAYTDAAQVGEDDRVLQQLLRLLAIHPGESTVQLAAARSLCNLAYDKSVASSRLAEPRILAALIQAMAASPGKAEIGAKASEAVARIVISETEGSEGGPVVAKQAATSALAGLYSTSLAGDASWHQVVLDVVTQLIANEVIAPVMAAQRFADAAATARSGAAAATGWFALAKQLATGQSPGLSEALISTGAIRISGELMLQYIAELPTQLAGIEAMSSLIGNRWSGLESFAEIGGCRRIQEAMERHGESPLLQTKALRALACGLQWPKDVQERAGYSPSSALALTKGAMAANGDNVELQGAAMEAIAKYLDKLNCVEEVVSGGGEGLVKAMMTRHSGAKQVQTWGRVVLDGIGSNRHWAPRGVAGNGTS